MRHFGLRRAATTMVLAGRMVLKTSPWARPISSPVLCAGEEHAGADDVLEAGAGLGEGFLDEAEDDAGLLGGGEIFSAYRAGAGDVDDVADANSAREADDGFVRRGAGDIVTSGHIPL